MIPVQLVSMVVVGAAGLAVVLARDVLRQTLVNAIYWLALVLLFVVFQAPDVALSAVAVGCGAFPVVILLGLAKVRARERGRPE
ncbi:MAG: energy-converting hydrogenase subunit [Gaiellaceae bacterium]|nr:energy-converting hydrogenase subunit [Gaiellaceae bacterium]MDX6493362.1 energy-converting hydrogenase subunit [Gaiellaceae bacterium]MDX6518817.1 energy-converting hydrogenase subunit [Gaiellaceae bacterium]